MYSCILRTRGPTPCRTWMGSSLGGSFAPLWTVTGSRFTDSAQEFSLWFPPFLSSVINFTSILSTGRTKLSAPSQDHPFDRRETNR
ncbi:hypothetical protein GDO81_029890 [Engystomops pustulosus]|uniref:Uncharacterized protein n=1 Tax=Engystomops pustulosus TaxID=76066 RepID=A0AAV6YIX1_ENGPU|nr:hypothetical protein GDO81_029890 [Engystomops pustulosus]